MKPLLALAFLALGLAGVIAVEVASGPEVIAPPAPAIRAVRAVPGDAAEATASWRAALLDRPVFSPDRRPPTAPAAAQDAARSLPRLSGVLIGPEQRRAIFADGAVLAIGEAVGPWRIGGIEEGSVTMLGPDGVQVLHPEFAAAGPQAVKLLEAPTPAPAPAHLTPPRLRRPK